LLTPATPPEEEGIGTLFTRLIDEGREFVSAEINVYRAITLNRLRRSQTAVGLAIAAALLAQASITALLLGLVLGLARWLGPIGSGIIVAVTGSLTAGLLLRAALKRFAAATEQVGGKESES
jgi:hypothetical protein